MSGYSFAVQFTLLLLVFDFAQWLIHNLLHRVPFLWRLHQVHHSVEEMDWITNWRFHWAEAAVYKVLLYPAAAFLGVGLPAMFTYAVVSTFVGHFAHSNLRIRLGPLKYLLNCPELHAWHHAHPDAGPVNRNFGVTLSVWDWLFGTAYAPGKDPERLGFEGIERYPGNIVSQAIAPFMVRRRSGHSGQYFAPEELRHASKHSEEGCTPINPPG